MSSSRNRRCRAGPMCLGALLAVLAVVATALAPVSAGATSPPAVSEQSQTTQEQQPRGPNDPLAGDAAAASYALDYGVTLAEANRRLGRIDPLHLELESIRSIESDRVAGWGIDHTGGLTGWVLLAGDQPASAAATDIADLHSDVTIRIGAAHTLAELMTAQHTFAGGSGLGPVGSATDGLGTGVDIADVVTFTLLDMSDNALHIGVDPALANATEPDEF